MLLAAVGLATALSGCGSDGPTGANRDAVVGVYHATTFSVTEQGSTRDLLQEGGAIALTLAADGTTSGEAVVPPESASGEPTVQDLTGTWSLSGSTVSLSLTADTFLRDVSLTVGPDRLSGDRDFSGVRVRVVLVKTTS